VSIPVELTLRERDLCFIDTETTGTQIGYHELIEIAGIRASPDGQIVKGEWSAKILPKFPERITPAAQKLMVFRWVRGEMLRVPPVRFGKTLLISPADVSPYAITRRSIEPSLRCQRRLRVFKSSGWITTGLEWSLWRGRYIVRACFRGSLCRTYACFLAFPPNRPCTTR
jgi:hypothetical protein